MYYIYIYILYTVLYIHMVIIISIIIIAIFIVMIMNIYIYIYIYIYQRLLPNVSLDPRVCMHEHDSAYTFVLTQLCLCNMYPNACSSGAFSARASDTATIEEGGPLGARQQCCGPSGLGPAPT